MADDHGGGDPMETLLFVFGGFALLVVAWYAVGGPAKTDFRGMFLNPPAPVGTGDAYGPQINTPTTTKKN